jgi:pyrophosphatase PpaX
VLGEDITDAQRLLLVGKPFSALFSVFPHLSQGTYDSIVDETLAYYKKRNNEIRSYPGIEPLLRELKEKGFRLGIVTAKLRENALSELSSNSIIHYFDRVLGKEDCREFKPSPVPLLDLAETLGVEPANCVYVGDQPSDIIAANSAGMVSCAALWGEGDGERLKSSQPDFVFDRVADFAQFLMRSTRRKKEGPDIV